MSETAYIDELLKAEQEATEIIENAQKERYHHFTSPRG
jgi:F0F1-type ATP synthase membrane subunit b/b'